MTGGVLDHTQFVKALKRAEETCKNGWGKKPEELQFFSEKKEEEI